MNVVVGYFSLWSVKQWDSVYGASALVWTNGILYIPAKVGWWWCVIVLNQISCTLHTFGNKERVCVMSAVHGADRASLWMSSSLSISFLSHSLTPAHARTHKHSCRLTFNLIFGQVDRGAVGEDVRDGAHAPVHQRGGYWVHRHDCDLWQPPAPSSYRNV